MNTELYGTLLAKILDSFNNPTEDEKAGLRNLYIGFLNNAFQSLEQRNNLELIKEQKNFEQELEEKKQELQLKKIQILSEIESRKETDKLNSLEVLAKHHSNVSNDREQKEEDLNKRLNEMMKLSLMKSMENPSSNKMMDDLVKLTMDVKPKSMCPPGYAFDVVKQVCVPTTESEKWYDTGLRNNEDTERPHPTNRNEFLENIYDGPKKEEPSIEVVDDCECCKGKPDFLKLTHSTSAEILEREKKRVNIRNVGLISGVYHNLRSQDFRAIEESVNKYVVAQAKQDNLSNFDSGIVVRDIFPDMDLLDGDNEVITRRQWLQYNNRAGRRCTLKKDAQTVYKTGRKSDNDRKVMCLYGFENFGYNKVNSIIIKRADVRTIDIIDTSSLDRDFGPILLKTPIMFKRSDDMNIEFIFDDYVEVTEIKPLIRVAEVSRYFNGRIKMRDFSLTNETTYLSALQSDINCQTN